MAQRTSDGKINKKAIRSRVCSPACFYRPICTPDYISIHDLAFYVLLTGPRGQLLYVFLDDRFLSFYFYSTHSQIFKQIYLIIF
jgi:hypothetical protein